jgi:hypothetical protein
VTGATIVITTAGPISTVAFVGMRVLGTETEQRPRIEATDQGGREALHHGQSDRDREHVHGGFEVPAQGAIGEIVAHQSQVVETQGGKVHVTAQDELVEEAAGGAHGPVAEGPGELRGSREEKGRQQVAHGIKNIKARNAQNQAVVEAGRCFGAAIRWDDGAAVP